MSDRRPGTWAVTSGRRDPAALGGPGPARAGGRSAGRGPARGARAFTLLEVVLATALMAMLAASLYASLAVAFRARTSALSACGPTRTCAMVMDLVGEDLRSAVVPKGVLAGAFLGQPGVDASGRESDALVFHCIVSDLEPAQGVGDIKRVEFVCEPAADLRGQVFLRRLTTNLLAPQTPEPREEVLCRGVSAFTVRYFNGSDWLDTWDSASEDNILPLAVEVTLELLSDRPGEASGGHRLSRVFLLSCGTAASETTEAAAAAP